MTDTSYRDMLMALLRDMSPEQPDDIDLSDVAGEVKLSLLVGCCAQAIEVSIRAMSKDRIDARKGLDALIVSMRRNIEEGPYGYQRPH